MLNELWIVQSSITDIYPVPQLRYGFRRSSLLAVELPITHLCEAGETVPCVTITITSPSCVQSAWNNFISELPVVTYWLCTRINFSTICDVICLSWWSSTGKPQINKRLESKQEYLKLFYSYYVLLSNMSIWACSHIALTLALSTHMKASLSDSYCEPILRLSYRCLRVKSTANANAIQYVNTAAGSRQTNNKERVW